MATWWEESETGRADYRRRKRDDPEKRLQGWCRQVAAFYGFRAWHLSQARATQQTPGLPDDFYTGGRRPLAVEYKVQPNKQTKAQEAFQAEWEESGGGYLLIYSVEELRSALEQESDR